METIEMTVTLAGLEPLLAVVSQYDAAVSAATTGMDPASDDTAVAAKAAAVQFCESAQGSAAVVWSADGNSRIVIAIDALGSEEESDNEMVTVVRPALDEVVAVAQQLAQSPENIANDLQANVTSADQQFQVQFKLVAPVAV